MKKKCIIISILTFPLLAIAQWSGDPMENTTVRDIEGAQVVSHICPTSAGETYISWYSNTEGKYDLYLQLFDHSGNKMWPETGVLVSDKPTDSWVTDYYIRLDHNDNIIITNQDQRDGHSNAFAFKVSPQGNLMWGVDGIRLTNDINFEEAPCVEVLGDNSCVFVYMKDPPDTTLITPLGIQKVDADGNLVWGENLIFNDTMDFFLPQTLLTENGNIMVSWLGASNIADTVLGQEKFMHVYIQKFDPDGQALWAEPVQVDTGNTMVMYSLWTLAWLANDGADGAYICWQSFEYHQPTVLVHRIGADGQLLWPGNGIPVVEITGQEHAEPNICYVPQEDNLFVTWREYKYDPVHLSDCWAIGLQKFSPDGDRLWGEGGNMAVPFNCSVDSTYFGSIIRDADGQGLGLFYQKEYLYIEAPDTTIVTEAYAAMLDYNGNFVWSDNIIPVTTVPSYKLHFVAGEFSQGQWVTAWEDNRENLFNEFNTGIYAQNVTIDGNLGPLSVDEIVKKGETVLNSYPNPFTDYLNLEYELENSSEVHVILTDIEGRVLLTLEKGIQGAGNHILQIGTSTLSPGLYMLHLQAGRVNEVIRAVKY